MKLRHILPPAALLALTLMLAMSTGLIPLHAAEPGANPVLASLDPQLAEAVKAPTPTVVHFWAPWCPNCKAEMGKGNESWAEFVRARPETRFVFVTVWNNGEDGRAALESAGIAGQPNVTLLADPNPSRGADKTKAFLGVPMTWIPTTWVYRDGALRYALNYGEVRFPVLAQMVDDTTASWSHK